MRKTWLVSQRKYDDIIDQLLYNRGVFDLQNKERFLEPNFERDLSDPFLLPDMRRAVLRIQKAIEKKEKIGIFADYDADGTPGAALLYRALKTLGVIPEVFIPTRADGYGLGRRGLDYLMKAGCGLIITVDLGIRNVAEAEYCRRKNLDLIITDHHLPGEEKPIVYAIINPKLPHNRYPDINLCGCALVYKLIQALVKFFPQITESFLKWNLDLVAISTIADMVPLLAENRVLAKYGLIVLRKTKNIGLAALIRAANIEAAKIDPYIVGFQIAPRINTPGRIDQARRVFELLTAGNENEARETAEWLNQKNVERQEEMDRVVAEAEEIIEKESLCQNKIIIVVGQWPRGVLGPPASRLVEKYNRPVIVMTKEEKEIFGSARSLEGIHILELISKVSKYLLKFGGHRGAAGITLSVGKKEKFIKKLTEVAEKEISADKLINRINVDVKAEMRNLTKTLFNRISNLEPFGQGNPRPIFMLSGINILWPRCVGKDGRHLSCRIADARDHHRHLKAIFFNFTLYDKFIQSNQLYDIIFNLNLETWNGQEQLSLNIIDIRQYRNV